MSFKTAFYAMDINYLEKYASLKDRISAESVKLSTDEVKRISADIQESRNSQKKKYTVIDNIAYIPVMGPLEPKPDPCAILFDIDMTTYQDIIEATNQAESDDNITKIQYVFDTPGGNVVGLFKTADVIRKTSKETEAFITGMCASAGYALASQCNVITSENISNETGSIGVVTELIDYSGQDTAMGVKRYIITSENAENKRPDITKVEGRDKIKKRLTDLEAVFHEYVAVGRNITINKVKDDFGRGSIFTSRMALKIGMIDKIDSELSAASNTSGSNNQNEEINTEDNMADFTMSEEDLQKKLNEASKNGAKIALSEMKKENEKKEAALKAETERKSGFTALLTKYPEQASMINEEMEKEGATASAEFAIKVGEAETARLAALDEHNNNSNDNENGTGKPDSEIDASEQKKNFSALTGALGVNMEVK